MAVSMMKEAWLERFGGCETFENTPAVIAQLEKRALDGVPTGSHVWSDSRNSVNKTSISRGRFGRRSLAGSAEMLRVSISGKSRSKAFGCWCLAKCRSTRSQLLSLR